MPLRNVEDYCFQVQTQRILIAKISLTRSSHMLRLTMSGILSLALSTAASEISVLSHVRSGIQST